MEPNSAGLACTAPMAQACGHRPGKEIVLQAEMVDRIMAAVDARADRHRYLDYHAYEEKLDEPFAAGKTNE